LFEIIKKQAHVISGIEGLNNTAGLSVKNEQQAEYEKRLDKLHEEKRDLYERLILGEMDANKYKAEKAVIDKELNRLTHALNTLKSEAAILSAAKSSDDELQQLAKTALKAEKLTRPLVDLLIDKVYIYPDNHVEITWKIESFISKKSSNQMTIGIT